MGHLAQNSAKYSVFNRANKWIAGYKTKYRVVNAGSGATVMTGDTGLSTGPAMSCSMYGMNMCAFVAVHNIPTWTSADCS